MITTGILLWFLALGTVSATPKVTQAAFPGASDPFRKDVVSIRQNYHEETEDAINHQINKELYVGYVYMSMGYYFERCDVALYGLAKFFKKASDEERDPREWD